MTRSFDVTAIRAEHHCTQPLIEHRGMPSTARASFPNDHTPAEVVDAFIEAPAKARKTQV
ncbi:MAG: cysteine desulfurase/selenocysteine lyase [Hyphomonas sp.]|jgi:cysteine desulfurase/selenocysteine lyase